MYTCTSLSLSPILDFYMVIIIELLSIALVNNVARLVVKEMSNSQQASLKHQQPPHCYNVVIDVVLVLYALCHHSFPHHIFFFFVIFVTSFISFLSIVRFFSCFCHFFYFLSFVIAFSAEIFFRSSRESEASQVVPGNFFILLNRL